MRRYFPSMGVYQRRRALAWRGAFGRAKPAQSIYTSTIGAAQEAWSANRARCIFSASLNESTLRVTPRDPPGSLLGTRENRRAAWSANRARCIFSASLNESTLRVPPGAPPGSGVGSSAGRAGMRSGRDRVVAPFPHSPFLPSGPGRLLRGVLDDLVTTAFPADCRVCGHPLLRLGTLPICDTCRTAVPRQDAAICGSCGEALDMKSVRIAPAEGLLCYPCRAVPPMFARAVAYAVYQDELREMIHLLKYERMRGVARLLGGMLAEAILMLHAEAAPELAAVAVPLFPAKQRERGYNQSELLADAAIGELRRRAPEWKLRRETGVLARQRDTRSQFELNPVARRRKDRKADTK